MDTLYKNIFNELNKYSLNCRLHCNIILTHLKFYSKKYIIPMNIQTFENDVWNICTLLTNLKINFICSVFNYDNDVVFISICKTSYY